MTDFYLGLLNTFVAAGVGALATLLVSRAERKARFRLSGANQQARFLRIWISPLRVSPKKKHPMTLRALRGDTSVVNPAVFHADNRRLATMKE